MAKQPKIRFKGFTEEWKDQRLGDIGKAISGIGFPEDCQGGKQGVPFYKVSDLSNVGNEFVMRNANNYVSEEQTKRYGWKPITQLPAILFAKVGAAVFLNRKRLVLSPTLCDNNTMLFTLKPNACEAFFAKYLFDNIYLPSLVQIGTLPSYNGSQVENIVVYLPKPDEQKRISGCLNELTKVISQRETELEKLKNIKRALLEKLFPQDGQSIPAIRFKGFEGEWEEMVAGDIFTTFDERNHPELPVLAATQDKGMVIRDEIGYKIAHNRNNEVTYKRVLPGQFVIHLRSFQGGFAHSNVEGITSPAYDVFGFKNPEEHDDYFWKYIFSSAVFIKRLVKVTYGIRDGRNVSYAEFLQLPFIIPSKSEQTKIAKFFIILSNLITLRERQLTLLKHSKQALLEQMFVNE